MADYDEGDFQKAQVQSLFGDEPAKGDEIQQDPLGQAVLDTATLGAAPIAKAAFEGAQGLGEVGSVGKNIDPFETGPFAGKDFYHGTRANIAEGFKPGQPTFLTPDPSFAESYAGANGKGFRAGGNVIPVRTSVSDTFDYEDPEHVKDLWESLSKEDKESIRQGLSDSYDNAPFSDAEIKKSIKGGDWLTLEEPAIQKALKEGAYDSFHVKENGVKNLAVFNPENIRSKFAPYNPKKGGNLYAKGGQVQNFDYGGQVQPVDASNNLTAVQPTAQSALTPDRTPLYDMTGKAPVLGSVEHGEVTDAVASGKYSLPQGTIHALDPDGKLGTMDAAEAPEAFRNGYRWASPDDIQQATYTTPEQQAKAAMEGAARGVLGPLATAGEKLFGVTDEAMQGRAKYNPGLETLGEVGGFAGSMLAGTGEAKLLGMAGEGAAKFAGLGGVDAARAAIAAAKTPQDLAAAQETYKAVSSGAKIASSLVKGATETMLMGGGDETSKLIMNDPNTSVQSAISNTLLSGVIGGVLSGGVSSISPLWKATFGEKLGNVAADMKGAFAENLANPNPVGTFTDQLAQKYEASKQMADEVYGATGLKAQAIQQTVPEMSDKIMAHAQETSDKMQGLMKDMMENPSSYPPRYVSAVQNMNNDYLAAVTKPNATSFDVFNAAQDMKQKFAEYAKYAKSVPITDESHAFVNKAKDMAFGLRNSLEDTAVWGKAGKLQQDINKAFTEYLPAKQNFESKFTEKVVGDMGRKDNVVSPGKAATYMNQLGKPNAEIKQGMLQDFLQATDKYQGRISQLYNAIDVDSPVNYTPTNYLTKTLNKPSIGQKIVDAMVKQGLGEGGGKALGAGVGAGIGNFILHGGAGATVGSIIGQAALGPFFSKVMPAIGRKIMESDVNPMALKATIDHSMNVVKGLDAVSKGTKAIFKAGARVLPDNLIPSDRGKKKIDQLVKTAQLDPESLTHAGGDYTHYLPDHTLAVGTAVGNVVKYLAPLKPSPSQTTPFDTPMQPTAQQKAAYDRALTVAEQPLTVLQHAKDGTIIPADVVAIKSMYPALYQQISTNITEHMINHLAKGQIVPYRTRMGLSMLLGQPLDSTMQPASIIAAQPQQPQMQPQTPTTPKTGPKSSTKSLSKVGSQYATKTQANEQKQVQA